MHGVVGEVTVAMNYAIQASLIILCIALGVAIPNVFFRRISVAGATVGAGPVPARLPDRANLRDNAGE